MTAVLSVNDADSFALVPFATSRVVLLVTPVPAAELVKYLPASVFPSAFLPAATFSADTSFPSSS